MMVAVVGEEARVALAVKAIGNTKMPIKNKKLILFLSLGVVLVGALFLLWKFDVIVKIVNKIKLQQLQQESQTFEKALSLLNTLEPAEEVKAIPGLESILKSPSSLDKEAHAKILLASAYFSSNRPIDAIKLLKETATNGNYLRSWRAVAVLHLALAVNDYPKDFREAYIFSGQPFETFYKEKDLSLAIRKLYGWSDELFPGVVPNYLIAHWYAERLIRDKISPYLVQNKKEAYRLILDYRLGKGDMLFAEVPMERWDQDMLLLSYLIKARILAKLYFINSSDEAKKIEAENYFKKALIVAQKTYLPKKMGYAAPFHYAAFLGEAYGTSKQAEIKSLLDPLYDSQRKPDFFNFLRDAKSSDRDGYYYKREIILAAKFDSRFEDLLKQLGWTEEQLNVKIASLTGE